MLKSSFLYFFIRILLHMEFHILWLAIGDRIKLEQDGELI